EAGRGQLAALVLAADLDVDEGVAVLDVFPRDLAARPGAVAHGVEAAHLGADALEEGGVAHPVGDQAGHPGRTLRAVVVDAGDADFLGGRFTMVADAGVLDAAAGLRIAEEVAGMLHRILEDDAVGVAAFAGDQAAHGVHQRQRAAGALGPLFAFLDLFPAADVAAPHVLFLVEDGLVDVLEFLGRVLVGLDVRVLAGVTGGLALVAGAGAEHPGDQFAALVGVAGLDVLQHQGAG